MFTGIITHLGTIKIKTADSLTLQVPADLYQNLSLGMSVAVNGICLTVTSLEQPDRFIIDFMPETAQKTTIWSVQVGDIVNLELPVMPTTLLAGHVVQGHVDGTSQLTHMQPDGNSYVLRFALRPSLTKYIVPKGSITINGISLTVITVTNDEFSVGIIPHTWQHTMLHTIQVGDWVNIEVDVLAKYVEKLLITQKA